MSTIAIRKISKILCSSNFGHCSSKTESEHLFHAMNSNKELKSMPLWNPMLLLMTGAALGAIVAKKL